MLKLTFPKLASPDCDGEKRNLNTSEMRKETETLCLVQDRLRASPWSRVLLELPSDFALGPLSVALSLQDAPVSGLFRRSRSLSRESQVRGEEWSGAPKRKVGLRVVFVSREVYR